MTSILSVRSGQSAISVAMPDGSKHILTTLLSHANHKQAKGTGFLSVGLTLTPRATGRAGRSLCSFATPGCAAACFADSARLAWPKNKRVAVARTRLLAQHPDLFFMLLAKDLASQNARAQRLGVRLVCRLNVVSDVPFEREFPALFTRFPDVQFMDYTKDVQRVLNPTRPDNYHLTFSRSERNETDCLRALKAGGNVATVFRRPPFPREFWGYPVIDGDANDLRFLDHSPCIVGLKAKGKARRDRTGFVIHADLLPPSVVPQGNDFDALENPTTTDPNRTLYSELDGQYSFERSQRLSSHYQPAAGRKLSPY
jgi:hypothetical protein